MILIRENVERVTSDPLVIDRLKKEGFREYEPEPKRKHSTKKGGTEND